MSKFIKLYEAIMNEAQPAISPSLLKQMNAKEMDAKFIGIKADGTKYHNPLGKLKTKASILKLHSYLRKGMELPFVYIFNMNGEVISIIKKVDDAPKGMAQAILISNPSKQDLTGAPKFIN